MGLHWFNPAHLIPLVEVVPAPATDAGVVERSAQLLAQVGKSPRVLQRAVPGFLANRLQYALIREALQLLEEGVADAETIDAAITECLGPRWAVIGPLRSSDLAGIDTAVAVAEQLIPTSRVRSSPSGSCAISRPRGASACVTGPASTSTLTRRRRLPSATAGSRPSSQRCARWASGGRRPPTRRWRPRRAERRP